MDAVDYSTYRFQHRSMTYDGRVAAEISLQHKRMMFNMRTFTFDPQDPLNILSFIAAFKSSCDYNGVTEVAALHLLTFFLKNPAHHVLSMRINRSGTQTRHHNGISTYCQVTQKLLYMYTTAEIIATTESDLKNFCMTTDRSPSTFALALQTKAIRFGPVYTEEHVIPVFVDSMPTNIGVSFRSKWADNMAISLDALARYANQMFNLNPHRPSILPTTTAPAPSVALIDDPSPDKAHLIILLAELEPSTGAPSDSPTIDDANDCRLCLAEEQVMDACPLCHPRNRKNLLARPNETC